MESQFRKSALMLEEKRPVGRGSSSGRGCEGYVPRRQSAINIVIEFETLQVATPPHGGVARATCPAGSAIAIISTLSDTHAPLADSP